MWFKPKTNILHVIYVPLWTQIWEPKLKYYHVLNIDPLRPNSFF